MIEFFQRVERGVVVSAIVFAMVFGWVLVGFFTHLFVRLIVSGWKLGGL